MDIKYVVNGSLDVCNIIGVFEDAGWNKNRNDIIDAFKKSYYILAYDDEQLVGFSRAISDGYYYTGIYDVVVRKQYQDMGIGREMVKHLVDKFKDTYIFITYTDGNKPFYEKCGFIENHNSMWIPK